MGQQQTIRNPLDCDADTYWKCVFDEEYSRRMYFEALGCRDVQSVSQEETPTIIRRKRKVVPAPADLPGPVAKLLGDVTILEETEFDKQTRKYRFRIIPSTLAERARVEGEIVCEPVGPKNVERVARINIAVDVPFVGAWLEKRMVEDLKKSYAQSASFTNEFVREKGW